MKRRHYVYVTRVSTYEVYAAEDEDPIDTYMSGDSKDIDVETTDMSSEPVADEKQTMGG